MVIKKILRLFKLKREVKKTQTSPLPLNEISFSAKIFYGADLVNTKIGDYSYIGKHSIVHNTTIGKFCSIGPNVVIGYGEHPINFVSTSPVFYQSTTSFDIKPSKDLYFGHSDIDIGSDVWIGANCVLKNGISIGHGAIIGAGAVVTKSVPPYAVVVGVPGKVIKYRFDDATIKDLLVVEWWKWDLEKIKSYHADFGTSDVNGFLNKHFNS
jgi:acetyltransferase-like isoleucine patch superfamily enzyme